MRWRRVEKSDDCDAFDPVSLERSPMVEDAEAAVFEAICQSSDPGPFVVRDCPSGEEAVVASLPDGHSIVSLQAEQLSEEDAEIQSEANVRLFCEARAMILRLLRDRERWVERERDLRDRIAVLENRLNSAEYGGEGGYFDWRFRRPR